MNQEEIDEIFASIVKDIYANQHDIREDIHYAIGETNEKDS